MLYELVLSDSPLGSALTVDPVCHMVVHRDRAAHTRVHDEKAYAFCSDDCAAAFDAEPNRYVTG
jgi:Cu+-exporting ATPase